MVRKRLCYIYNNIEMSWCPLVDENIHIKKKTERKKNYILPRFYKFLGKSLMLVWNFEMKFYK